MTPTLNGLRLLVVDNDADMRKIVELFLKPEGMQITFASSGSEAVEKYKQMIFDLAFIDLMMPGMSGLDVARNFRNQELASQRPSACLIAMTALDSSSIQDSAVSAGMDEIIQKPIDKASLILTMKRVLFKKHET